MKTLPSIRTLDLHDITRAAEFRARRVVAGSPRLRRMVYSAWNRRQFADLIQHDRMLADTVRVDSYYEALAAHIRPGDVVVDLGTGTGILAMFASRLGASRVHAIEHGPIIDAARAVAKDNGIDNIVFHRMHSTDFELPERADVILHEQIGEALFDERMVENVADLRDRVLKPGGRILPAHVRLFVEPVTLRPEFHLPFAWEQRLHGLDFRALERFGRAQPAAYTRPRFQPVPIEHFLTTPAPVVEADLHHVRTEDLPKSISYRRTAVADGVLSGLCVYFSAGFDDDRWFTSSPDQHPTSWGSNLLRVEHRTVRAGDTIELSLSGPDLAHPSTWEWEVTVRPGA